MANIKENLNNRSFIKTRKVQIAATILGATIGLAGCGFTAQQTENNSSSPTPTQSADVIFPSNSPELTIAPSASPSEKPTEIPLPTPTEAPIPAWIKEIPVAKWTINNVPLNELTKNSGQLVEYPVPDSPDYVLSIQNATIVAVEPNAKDNTVWVAMSVGGTKLTKETKTFNFNGENKNYYAYKGLTVWYEFDNNINVLKKNPTGSKTSSSNIGVGLSYLAKDLKVGDTFFGILALMNQGTINQPTLNIDTLNEINNSIGQKNIRDNKMFELYSQTVELHE